MFGVVAVSLAQLMTTSPEPEEPRPDPPEITRTLAEARAAYSEALARNEFLDDAPEMRALAETLAPTLAAAWLDASGSPDLQSQAVELMAATAGDALRPFLVQHRMAPAIAGPWLRWHDDAVLIPLTHPPTRSAATRALAIYRPDRAVSAIAAWIEDSDINDRDSACQAALRLPPAHRRRLVGAALSPLLSVAPGDHWPACLRLAIEHPSGRRWLRAAVLHPSNAPRENGPERWPAVAAALLVASGPADPPVTAALSRWTAFLATRAESPFRRGLATTLLNQSPWWPDTPPPRRAPVLALTHAIGTEGVRLWALRRSLGDARLFSDAVYAIASPALQQPMWAEALRVVGISAPADPRSRSVAVEALDLLRSRLRSWAIDSVSPREVERWRTAIQEAHPCAPGTCAEVVERADDALAARTVALGLPLDDPRVARAVVRRVVTAGEEFTTPDGYATRPSALAAVALTTVARCPPSLRALSLSRPPIWGRSRSSALDPWRERHAGRCAVEPRRP